MVKHTSSIESKLIKMAVQGDADAFSRLVKMHERILFNFALSVTGGRHAMAEDILQEALMKAFTHMSDFKEDASFKTWLWTIIRREFINFVTRPKTRSIGVPIIGEFSDGDSFEDEIAKKQRSEALWRLIGELSVDEQEVIILVDMEGYRYDEAAEMIGLTVPALKSRLFRARKKLIKQAVEQRKLFL